jgi:hypothetical protein
MFRHITDGEYGYWIYIFATIAILLTIVRSNKRIKMLLNKNIIAEALFGTTFLILTFCILKEFMLWWAAIIIALLLTYLADIIFKD